MPARLPRRSRPDRSGSGRARPLEIEGRGRSPDALRLTGNRNRLTSFTRHGVCLSRGQPCKTGDVRDDSGHHFGEDASGLFPQIVVHIARRFQAQSFSGDYNGLFDRNGADQFLDLRDVVRRHAQLTQPEA